MKKMHNITNINEIKVCAYESYWLLRRHPLQIIDNKLYEEKVVFANEKFVFSILSFQAGKIIGEDCAKQR